MSIKRTTALFLFLLLLYPAISIAEKPKGPPTGPPPARVVVGDVTSGKVSPTADFIGTVYYEEVSEVAAEVRGKAVKVAFDDGDSVKEGAVLVTLDTELLKKSVESTNANYEQVLTDLESANKDFGRIKSLYEDKFVSDKDYDEANFRVRGLEKRAASLKAELEGMRVELGKKTIRAPFKGVVIERHVDRGEWLEAGKPVATIASLDKLEVVVDVPEKVMAVVKRGKKVSLRAGGKKLTGKVSAVILRGNVKTRTFPIKIRISNSGSLAEGMEAIVTLPSGKQRESLIVPRDAILIKPEGAVVYAVAGGMAKMVVVEVLGYTESTAGVISMELTAGMKVVTKGNERLRPGQPLIYPGAKGGPPAGK